MLIDVEGQGSGELGPRLGYTIPPGVVHRTRAPRKTLVLMFHDRTVGPSIGEREASASTSSVSIGGDLFSGRT